MKDFLITLCLAIIVSTIVGVAISYFIFRDSVPEPLNYFEAEDQKSNWLNRIMIKEQSNEQ